jgi:hypothetical protein
MASLLADEKLPLSNKWHVSVTLFSLPIPWTGVQPLHLDETGALEHIDHWHSNCTESRVGESVLPCFVAQRTTTESDESLAQRSETPLDEERKYELDTSNAGA